MKKYLLGTLLLPLPLNAALIECWTFNDLAAGGLTGNGTEVSFGINGSPAVIRGAGASATGSAIDLPGGSSASAAYIDLPNGLVSNKSSITLSSWVTISSTTSPWQRIFDFGSTDTGVGPQGGELFGPGGGGQGLEYILLAPAQGNNPNAQRLEYRENGATINTTDSAISTPIGSEHLFTFVWEDMGGGLARQGWYLDGSLVTMSANFTASLSALNDVNNWLGRSNWTVDGNTDGTFNQFALYDHAMTGAEVAADFAAGPSHIPETSSALLAAGAVLGLGFRRRRA
jgi:MYXO-CTERM domain-containing protein